MSIDARALKKYLPYLLKAKEENLNEADTVQRLIKVFEDVLGYDAMSDISRETSVKDKYVDVALKIDGATRLLVEVKAASTTLRDRHIEQAQSYAANANIKWVILTNGITWNLYHLTFEDGIESTQAFSVDLSEGVTPRVCELLGLLVRQSIKKGQLDSYWEHRVALGPASLGRAIFMEDTLKFIRREIRRREGILIDEEDLASAIHGMLSTDAREQVGPVKIRRRQKRPKAVMTTTAEEAAIPHAANASGAATPSETVRKGN